MGYPRVSVHAPEPIIRNPNYKGWAGHSRPELVVGPERIETEAPQVHDIYGDGWDPDWYGFAGDRNPHRSIGGRHRFVDTYTYVEEEYPNELTHTGHRYKKW